MSPYPVVRKQARQALLVLSEVTGKTVKEMLEPLPKDLITETVSHFNTHSFLQMCQCFYSTLVPAVVSLWPVTTAFVELWSDCTDGAAAELNFDGYFDKRAKHAQLRARIVEIRPARSSCVCFGSLNEPPISSSLRNILRFGPRSNLYSLSLRQSNSHVWSL